MNVRLILIAILFLAGLFVGVAAVPAWSGDYSLPWWTIDGGGMMGSSDGPFTLSGTLGQSDAGTMGSGPYTLQGGFWGGVLAVPAVEDHVLHLPIVMKNP